MDELLDRFLPEYGRRVVHGITVAAPPERVWAALQAVTLDELPLPRALLALRTLPSRLRGKGPDLLDRSVPLAELFRRDGRWVVLAEEPGRALVLGRVARFWRPVPQGAGAVRDAGGFLAFEEPGYAKAVISHRVVAQGTGSRLVTETRIRGTDVRAARLFAGYWFLIRPGVGLIRRSALAAVGRRCGDNGFRVRGGMA
ncbi:hypothetical protein ACIRBX_25525 [Kitasatospora sp. NPDC096147]|uniref:hypothetical protein n=1 Tax=Kitasatospora sp. NPDC096147 TaxID=3364093 RepID=UPI003803C80E